MTVHTEITQADWTAFVRFVIRSLSQASGGKIGRWLIAIGVGAAVGLTFSLTGIGLHVPSLLVGALAGTLWIVVISRLQTRQVIPAADGYILGPRQVVLTDAGLRETSKRHETFFHWHAVRGAQITDEHVFVMVDSTAAIIVPRRSFPSDAEQELFVAEIQRRSVQVMT